MELKYNIKEIRIEKNLTLKQLSKKSGVSVECIHSIEDGFKDASFSTIIKLAKALDKQLNEVYCMKR